MKNIEIIATMNSPEIIFDELNKTLTLSGDSYPENSFEFYKPLFDWWKSYIKSPLDLLQINFNIVYFNSTTSKVLYDFFDQLEESITDNKINLIVHWYYHPDNDFILEAGEEYQEDYKSLDIKLIEQPV